MLDSGNREIEYTLRCSTILVSDGDDLDVFHSLEELPDSFRKRVTEQSRRGVTATIFIANRGGREELTKHLRGLPSRVRTRLETQEAPAGSTKAPAKRRTPQADLNTPAPRFSMLPEGWPLSEWLRQALLVAAGMGAVWGLLALRGA